MWILMSQVEILLVYLDRDILLFKTLLWNELRGQITLFRVEIELAAVLQKYPVFALSQRTLEKWFFFHF